MVIEAPITRRKVYELVAEQLLAQISDGRLRPGEAVPTERDLTQAYRVGRSSVREALRILESQGLITPVGNGTFRVAGEQHLLNQSLRLLLALNKADLAELYEVRKIVESEAASLAAARRTDADLGRIAGTIERMGAGLGSQEQFSDSDLAFHLTIAEATRNRVIVHVMIGIRDLLRHSLGSVYRIPGVPARALDQHRVIARALERGAADAARRAMLQHLVSVEEQIRIAAGGAGAAAGGAGAAAGSGRRPERER